MSAATDALEIERTRLQQMVATREKKLNSQRTALNQAIQYRNDCENQLAQSIEWLESVEQTLTFLRENNG